MLKRELTRQAEEIAQLRAALLQMPAEMAARLSHSMTSILSGGAAAGVPQTGAVKTLHHPL
jgi:hypothetical protein